MTGQRRNEGPVGLEWQGEAAGGVNIIVNNINKKVREVPVDWMRRRDVRFRGVTGIRGIAPG